MNTYKILNKFISLVLVLSFVLSMLSLSAYAEMNSFETDFNSVTVDEGNGITIDTVPMFTNVQPELLGDEINKYIKGLSTLTGSRTHAFEFLAKKVTISGTAVLDFDVYLAASSEVFSVRIVDGRTNQTVIKFDRTNGFDISGTIITPDKVTAGWHNIKILIDYENYYSVIIDNKLVAQNYAYNGDVPNNTGIRIQTKSGVDNLKYYTPVIPFPYDAGFETAPKVGTVSKGKASVHSLQSISGNAYTKEYSYYISPTENGTYEKITSSDANDGLYITPGGELAIMSDCADSFVKVGAAIVSGDGLTKSYEAMSEPVRIVSCDEYTLTAGTPAEPVRFKLTSPLGSENIAWSLVPADASGVSITADGVISVTDNTSDVYVKSTNTLTGNIHMQKLAFISASTDGAPLAEIVYPVVFKTNVNIADTTVLSSGGVEIEIASNGTINGIPVADNFVFKLVFDSDKYYAFAGDTVVETGTGTSRPLKLEKTGGTVTSYYAGSPLATKGVFVKHSLPASAGVGTTISPTYEFYNESGIYPDSYTVEWFYNSDASPSSTDEDYYIPFNKIGSKIRAKISAVTDEDVVAYTNKADIISQYELTIESDGDYSLVLNSADCNVYALLVGDSNKSVFCADMELSYITDNMPQTQDYTLYLINKSDLSLRGMPVRISGTSHYDWITDVQYINYLTRKGVGAETNTAALFEKPYAKSELMATVFSDGMKADLSDIIRDVYISSDMQTSYTNGSVPDDGRYNLITVNNADSATADNLFYSNKYKLFTNVSHFDYANFPLLVEDALETTTAIANDICHVLSRVSNKNRVCSLVGTDPSYFPAAVYMAFVSEHSAPSDGALDTLKSKLNTLGITADFIPLLKKASSYSSIMSSINYSSGLSSIASGLKDRIILSEVEKAPNYKNIKQFLEHIGSSLYNDAGETLQNHAAEYVYKKVYSSLSALKSDVEYAINNPPKNNYEGGGGGGGGMGGSAVQSGTVSNPQSPNVPIIPQGPFGDVASDHWAYSYIINMNNLGIISGYDGKFRPEDTITRAEYVKIICGAFGIQNSYTQVFGDVNTDDWFAPYVNGAYAAGIVQGDGTAFNPQAGITREDAAVMLWRLLKLNGVTQSGARNIFNDKDFSSYAIESISGLTSLGVINGMTPEIFAPKQNITRAQAAKIVYMSMSIGGDR